MLAASATEPQQVACLLSVRFLSWFLSNKRGVCFLSFVLLSVFFSFLKRAR
jgi:hypothetical protein